MSALSLSASLLEHFQHCQDVFLIFALEIVRGNTVPRGSIDPYTPGSGECFGYYDFRRSCHVIQYIIPVANEYQEIHPCSADKYKFLHQFWTEYHPAQMKNQTIQQNQSFQLYLRQAI